MNNRRSLIFILAALGVSLVGVGILLYMQTFKTVSFNFKRDPLHVTVYKQENDSQTAVAKLDATSQLRLQAGTYTIISDGSQYDSAGTQFEVKDKDLTVQVDPEYSIEYRDTILASEEPTIQAVISAAYPNIIDQFTFTRGTIYGDGQWYATTLRQKTAPQEEPDVYRTVLKKEDGTWIIKAKPTLVLSAADYPDIPKNILTDINAN